MKQITREMMIEAVEKGITSQVRMEEISKSRGKKSWAVVGARYRQEVARRLLSRLNNGGKASTQEVVGYFGKGARWGAAE